MTLNIFKLMFQVWDKSVSSMSDIKWINIENSAVKQLNAINHIQNKSFCLHNICVYGAYLLCIHKHKHMHVYI